MPALGWAARGREVSARNAFDHVQHGHRAHAAIAPDDVDTPALNPRRKALRRRAVQTVAVFVDRDLGHDWNFGIHLAGSQNRLVKLLDIPEGFEHEHVNPSFNQGGNLLAEGGASLLEGSLAQRFNAHAERAHRAGHPNVETLGRFLARRAPARLISRTRSPCYAAPGGNEFPPKVLVSIISAPACRYS